VDFGQITVLNADRLRLHFDKASSTLAHAVARSSAKQIKELRASRWLWIIKDGERLKAHHSQVGV
jgi:hypothetical protein